MKEAKLFLVELILVIYMKETSPPQKKSMLILEAQKGDITQFRKNKFLILLEMSKS